MYIEVSSSEKIKVDFVIFWLTNITLRHKDRISCLLTGTGHFFVDPA